MALELGLPHFLAVAAALFVLGVATVILRRNALAILMGIELLFNAANLNLVAFSRFGEVTRPATGHTLVILTMLVAAAEVAVALAIALRVFRTYGTIDTSATRELKE